MCLIQDHFKTQHALEPTRGERVLYLVLSSQKEFVDKVKIQEPLGRSDHNQLHFNIKIKSDKTDVSQCGKTFTKGNYKEMRKILGFLMAEELNMHFSPVFTREDTSSLSVPETKLNGTEGEGWGSYL